MQCPKTFREHTGGEGQAWQGEVRSGILGKLLHMGTEERPMEKKQHCVCKKKRVPREKQIVGAPADKVCPVRLQWGLPRKDFSEENWAQPAQGGWADE